MNLSKLADRALSSPLSDGQRAEVEAVTGPLDDSDAVLAMAVVVGMAGAAAGGNVSAFNALVAALGAQAPREAPQAEKPAYQVIKESIANWQSTAARGA